MRLQIINRQWFIRMGIALAAIAALLFMGNIQQAEAAGGSEIHVFLDQEQVAFKESPLLDEGTTFVQMRPLFEALQITLDWDGQEKIVTGSKEGLTFSLTIGKPEAIVNGDSVILDQPARIVNGHTLVPLRYISEVTGALVGWDGVNRLIGIYSSDFTQTHDMQEEDIKEWMEKLPRTHTGSQEGDAETPVVESEEGVLQGVYASYSLDILGYCGGLCWSYYTFFPGDLVYTKEPIEGPDAISCDIVECLSYTIEGGQITLSNGETKTFERVSNEEILISGNSYKKIQPEEGRQLDGEFRSFSYVGNNMGGGVAAEAKYEFTPDGDFYDGRWAAGMTDGSDTTGDGSGVSTTVVSDEQTGAGTYEIRGNTIILTYNDGSVERKLFFLPNRDGDTKMLRIGGSDYLLEE